MARYQVILAYDGTQFRGFQRLARDRSVQSTVEAALKQIGWTGETLLAAGRTDTGVHASGQVIAFDMEWKHGLSALQSALNAHLPPDVAALGVYHAPPDFHPRYDAVARRYRYCLYCQAVRDPLKERYAWRVWPAVDQESLLQVARYLVGTHDFAAFGTPPRSGGSTIRSVHQAGWQQEGPDLVFEVVANAFLYHMVRRLVFAQVSAVQGRLEGATLEKAVLLGSLEGKALLRGLAPSQGLVLAEVIYPPEIVSFRLQEDPEAQGS